MTTYAGFERLGTMKDSLRLLQAALESYHDVEYREAAVFLIIAMLAPRLHVLRCHGVQDCQPVLKDVSVRFVEGLEHTTFKNAVLERLHTVEFFLSDVVDDADNDFLEEMIEVVLGKACKSP